MPIRFPRGVAIRLILIGIFAIFFGCKSGEITEYQLPATIHRAFKKDHPNAGSAQYSVQMRDSVKVYQIDFVEGETEQTVFYDVQGRLFVSKAERRRAEQEKAALEEDVRQNEGAGSSPEAQAPDAGPETKNVP